METIEKELLQEIVVQNSEIITLNKQMSEILMDIALKLMPPEEEQNEDQPSLREMLEDALSKLCEIQASINVKSK